MSQPQTTVILGGGVGGISVARALRRRLARQHRILLIDRERDHVFAPSLLWLMVGRRTPAAITRPVARLAGTRIEVETGDIQRIDPERREVTAGGRVIAADHLVIALGAELNPEAIPGLKDAGHNFYTLGGARSLWDALQGFRGGRIVVLTAAPAYKCPAAPYEGAMLVDGWLRRSGRRDAVQIDLYAAEPAPMGVAGAHVSNAVRQLLAAKGIGYHPEHQITVVDVAGKRLTFANGTTADYDLLAYVPPHRAPAVVRESGMAAASGWIAVDRHTLETQWPQVYAIGDVVGIPLKLGKPLPKAGVFAHRQGEVVARNIAAAIAGAGASARFDGEGECFIETGDGRAGFGGGNFYAEPTPSIRLRQPSRRWHWGKVWFEKAWLYTKI